MEATRQLRSLKLTGDLAERAHLNDAIANLETLELNIRTGGGAQPGQFQTAYAAAYNALARYNFYKAQGFSNPHNVLQDGSILKPDGTVIKPDGTVLRPVRVTVTPQNTYIRVEGQQPIAPNQLESNQVLLTNAGDIIYPNGTVVKRQQRSSSSSSYSSTGPAGSVAGQESLTIGTESNVPGTGSKYESHATSNSEQSSNIGGVSSRSRSSMTSDEARYYTNEALANYEAYAREANVQIAPEVQNRISTLRSWSSSSSSSSSSNSTNQPEGLPPTFSEFNTTIEALPPVTRTRSESQESHSSESTEVK